MKKQTKQTIVTLASEVENSKKAHKAEVKQIEKLLKIRTDRYYRLVNIQAPPEILQSELRLIAQASVKLFELHQVDVDARQAEFE